MAQGRKPTGIAGALLKQIIAKKTGQKPKPRTPGKLVGAGLGAAGIGKPKPRRPTGLVQAALGGRTPRRPTGMVGAGLEALTPRRRYNLYKKRHGPQFLPYSDWLSRYGGGNR